MKNFKIFSIVIAFIFCVNANSQIQVGSTGLVGIGGITPNTNLQVGANTSFNSSSASLGADFRMCAYNSSITWCFLSARDNSGTGNIGMLFRTQSGGSIVQNMYLSANGWLAIGYGQITPSSALQVNGNIYATGSITSYSDKRLKININNIVNPLIKLTSLQGVSYNLITNGYNKLINRTDTTKTTSVATDTALYNHLHMGFIAQDVQKIFPNLVYTDRNGILSLDYIGLIPILVESIKTLVNQRVTDSINYIKQINTLAIQFNKCCGTAVKTATSQSDQVPISSSSNPTQNMAQNEVATLAQNAPNPFNQNTTIGYYLPSNVANAVIYIYNLQGSQIQSYTINDRGNGSLVISGNSLTAGMYIYALITDGTLIDTKRMILTN